MNLKDAAKLVERTAQTKILPNGLPARCIICNGEPIHAALYLPDEETAKRVGAKAGKLRGFVYMVCDPCSKLEDRLERIEARIIRGSMLH
jgi:hypothetical protein